MGKRGKAKLVKPVLCAAVALATALGGFAIATAQGSSELEEPALTYTAVVIDADTGKPVEGASVSVQGAAEQTSDVDGAAEFALEEDAVWQAHANADGYEESTGAVLDGSLGDVEEIIELYPEEPSVSEDGAPGEAELPVEGVADEEAASGETSSDGEQPGLGDAPAENSQEEAPETSDSPSEGSESNESGTGPGQDADTEAPEPESEPQPEPQPEPEPETPKPAGPETQQEQPSSSIEADEPLVEAPVETPPPAWALTGDLPLAGNLSMAEEMRLLDAQLSDQAKLVREELEIPEDAVIGYDSDNAADVWAAYAVLSGMEEGFPYRVEVSSVEAREMLRSIYWTMTSVSGVSKNEGDDRFVIHVERKTWDECAEELGIADYRDELKAMTGAGSRSGIAKLCSESILAKLSNEELDVIEDTLEGTEGRRRAVVLAALSLEHKVPYFYGGKSDAIGWNPAWGQLATVSGDETLAGGSAEPYGLDCSGFVTWAFVNACGTTDASAYIGHGTSAQWASSKPVEMADALPGDLVFLAGSQAVGANNHVGIVVANDGGNLTVVHCSGSADNVVVTDASQFNYARSPYLYGEEVK